MISSLKKEYLLFIFFILLYLLLGVFNLETLPVAWTDEIMHIDPAMQFIKKGEFTSKVWPNEGSEIIFASYPPLIHWWHTLWISLTNPTIFMVRLPFLIIHTCSLILIFNYLINKKLKIILATFIVIAFALDKTVFEISRSVRIEVFIIFLITLYITLQHKTNLLFIRSLILGLMAIAHLYLWPIILVWFISELLKLKIKNGILFTIVILIPVATYLHSIHYEINTLIDQIGKQATDHQLTSGSASHNALLNSFYYRFFPHYNEQPFVFIGFVILISLLLKNCIPFKNLSGIRINEFGFVLLFITIFFLISPQYRYLPILTCLGVLLIPSNINVKVNWFLVLVVSNGAFSFFARHSTAIIQRSERLSKPMLNFINEHIDTTKKTLILGESIGAYYCFLRRDTLCDYGIDFYPQHWNWGNYHQVILMTKKEHNQGIKIAQYSIKNDHQLPKWVTSIGKGGSYNLTNIYRLK
jgi:hypothetical protein